MAKYEVETIHFGPGMGREESTRERCAVFTTKTVEDFPSVYDLVEAATKEFPKVSLANIRVIIDSHPHMDKIYLRAIK